MKNKYYVPRAEEFHIGFEFEFRPRLRNGLIAFIKQDHEYVKWWKKQTISRKCATLKELLYDYNSPYNIEDVLSYHKDNAIRVKFLNKEGIKELGWEEEESAPIKPELQYYSNKKKREYSLFYNPYNLWVLLSLQFYRNEDYTVFAGYIKNKSELKKIMEMVGIK